MATLAKLQSYRERLIEAVYSGSRRLRDSNGEEIEFRSQSELKSALAALDREISNQSQQSPQAVRFNTSKGL